MILLIDAYNVIKMALGKHHIRDDERVQFIVDLSRYSKKKSLTLIAVFDGGPTAWPSKDIVKGITVVHSGTKESADDYIKHYLVTHKGRDILMISSDRELCEWASRQGVPSLDALEFYSLMRLALQKPKEDSTLHGTRVVKTTQEEHPELDMLMEQEIVGGKVEEVAGRATKREGKQLSKIDRLLFEKMKKL